MNNREYHYFGPSELRDTARTQPSGTRISTCADLRDWLTTTETDRLPQGTCIATFTLSLNRELFIAPRRSEHVACASGGPVLSAGEVTFDFNLIVTEITNQSTGYCTEPECWSAVVAALDQIGIAHPGRFTTEIVFRLCPDCRQRNVVKDAWFYCDLCDGKLPEHWNFTRHADAVKQ